MVRKGVKRFGEVPTIKITDETIKLDVTPFGKDDSEPATIQPIEHGTLKKNWSRRKK